MNNDLISRSELKKAFESWKYMDDYYHDTDCDDIPFSEAYDLIDNAPAINFIINPDYVTELQNLNKELIKQLEDMERPTGEWVLQTYERFDNGNELYKYNCNKCGHREEHAYSDSKFPNFCPNCGAKMRGGVN